MSQHDYDITTADANTGPTLRAAINIALQALASNNMGATEPDPTYAGMWWPDTGSDMLKQRNAADSAWINKGKLSDILLAAGALQTQDHIRFAAGGTADAITGTLSPAITSYSAGLRVTFSPSGPNTSVAPTLNLNSLGVKTIKKKDSSGVKVALATSDLNASGPSDLEYDGMDFVLMNPATAIASASGGFKNKIIGGDFATNPWQRGTSFTALASGSFGPDRFRVSNGTTAVVDVLKTADAPAPALSGTYTSHCLHADVTTADASIAAGENYGFVSPIEGLNTLSFGFGQSGTRYITLSFWHKHTKTGTYCVGFRNSAANRSYVAEYTQAVTDTWERATITLAVDITGTWLYDSGIGISLLFSLAGGSTYQTTANTWTAGNYFATASQVNALDSTSNNFKLALIQLEAGSVATPFETRDVGEEETLCQRYYYRVVPGTYRSFGGAGHNSSNAQHIAVIPFPVKMRSGITAIEHTGVPADYGVYNTTVVTALASGPQIGAGSDRCCVIEANTAATMTAGHGGHLRSAAAGAYLGFSAEL